MTTLNIPGWIVETNITSYTGKILYSDYVYFHHQDWDEGQTTILNEIARTPVLGIAAGVVRIALGVIHTLGHTFLGAVTLKKGHFYHAAKGACEILCGIIEAIPIVGRIFVENYREIIPIWSANYVSISSWWIMKIYNPQHPDKLDKEMGYWQGYKTHLTTHYIRA